MYWHFHSWYQLPFALGGMFVVSTAIGAWRFRRASADVYALCIRWASVMKYRCWKLTPVAHATILNTLPDAVVVLNARQRIVRMNRAAEQILALSGHEVIGKVWGEVAPCWLPRVMTATPACVTPVQHVCAGEGAPMYDLIMREIPPVARHRGWLVVLRDVTADVLMMEEHERKTMAVFVHDDIGQSISAALLHLSKAQRHISDDMARASCDTVATILEAILQRSKVLTRELNVPTLLDRGVVPALQWLAQTVGDTFQLDIRVHAQGALPEMSMTRRRLIERITRELLFNTIKHAQAREVAVTLASHASMLHLTVVDDGRGFDPRRQRHAFHAGESGFGLASIQEQVEWERGSLQIASAPGGGAAIVITLPEEVRAEKVEALPCSR